MKPFILIRHKKVKQAANKITNLVNSYRIEAIAIGNGTAGRENRTIYPEFAL